MSLYRLLDNPELSYSLDMNSKTSSLVIQEVDSTSLIVYHSLLGEPQLLEFDCQLDKIEFLSAMNLGQIKSGFESLDRISMLSDCQARRILLRKKREYLSQFSQQISFLSLLTAENCNLDCSYCIASMNMDDAKRLKSTLMPWRIAKTGLDWYFQLHTHASEYYVNFSGGEPLINKEVVKQSIEYVRSMQVDKPIRITINTNATLIDGPLAEFFAFHNIEIATSLDGTPEASDKVRMTRGGLPASSKILSNWKQLRYSGCALTGFMATFNDKNINYLDTGVVDFAKEFGFSWLRIACDVIHLLNYPVADAIEKIWSVYEYGVAQGIIVEGFWSTAINNLTLRDRNPESAGFFCGAVSGETISVHPDGRLSACGFSSGNFGNILNPRHFNFSKRREFISEHFPGSREFCKGCSIEGSCAGGCDITREVSIVQNNESAIAYNCEMYRELTKRLLVDHFQRTEATVQQRRQFTPVHY